MSDKQNKPEQSTTEKSMTEQDTQKESVEQKPQDQSVKKDSNKVDSVKTSANSKTESTQENKAPANKKSEPKTDKQSEPKPTANPEAKGKQGTEDKEKKAGKKAITLATVAILLSLGAAGAAGYGVWLQKNQTDQQLLQLSETNSQLQAKLQQQAQQLNGLNNLKQLPSQTQKLAGEQDKQRQQMIQLAGELAKTQGPKPSDWLQAEAEYLLRLANHRLQLEGDIKGAETLLGNADERLKEADNPSLFAVREAIAQERLSLSALAPVDKSGLFFAIAALENRIDQLPLPLGPEDRSSVNSGLGKASADSETPIWQTLWQEAKSLIVVRHRDEAITPLLPPQESMYLRHNLRLTLQQAQIALMKEDSPLYKTLMQQASDWVGDHFDTKQHLTQTVLKELGQLAKGSIHNQRPDISASLQLLRDLQKQRFSPAVIKETKA
jgi:uroporphyrin-3 C-methyltransferase